MSTKPQLPDYYAARAAEFERVYAKPERQNDLAHLRHLVAEQFAGRRVLELAAGTGYWTTCLARHAQYVLATDVTPEVLEIAKAKHVPDGRVAFAFADAFALEDIVGEFDACFGGFWWSHIPREETHRFLTGLHHRLGVGALVMFLDNRFVAGSNTPIARRDTTGNTYQVRRLDDGSLHDVLKNFPARRELLQLLSEHGAHRVEIVELAFYWYALYEVACAA